MYEPSPAPRSCVSSPLALSRARTAGRISSKRSTPTPPDACDPLRKNASEGAINTSTSPHRGLFLRNDPARCTAHPGHVSSAASRTTAPMRAASARGIFSANSSTNANPTR